MVAAPTPIPERRPPTVDALDVSLATASSARSPLGPLLSGSFQAPSEISSPRYMTPTSASLASQWAHSRHNSISGASESLRAPDSRTAPNLSSSPKPGSSWTPFLRYDSKQLRDPTKIAKSNTDTPFSSLYRQFSGRSPRRESLSGTAETGMAYSYGSTISSNSPITPQRESMPDPEPVISTPSRRSYADCMEHLDADGMWPQHLALNKTPVVEPAQEARPSFRRTLQHNLSPHSRRKPSPMGERMLMGHLDTQ
ncbi:hypothetical protein MVES1_001077 [Malassezia vespertilionis]|uniref:Uncharacterized protein n=1 Tax=Malassezia vespertilionis TaxID=2020962 RepID=A0A2N1JEL7_9BASI|nr:uncharacterized protein MVES1_001077 [Malassezia vespertilionis]PKI84998.1 hypothetical protein MVES_001016 [Malassezia vespertilionis]WFD05744.1 hypothetical protein MVES1_001077 [Malassezia vespertilionis]